MAVTEKHRHELFNPVERLLGERHAETLMELLPPVGWADVATKHDLDALRAATRQDIDALRSATRQDIDALRSATRQDVELLRAEVKHEFELVRAEMATKSDIDALRRQTATWLFTAMGIQTATIGLLVTFAGG